MERVLIAWSLSTTSPAINGVGGKQSEIPQHNSNHTSASEWVQAKNPRNWRKFLNHISRIRELEDRAEELNRALVLKLAALKSNPDTYKGRRVFYTLMGELTDVDDSVTATASPARLRSVRMDVNEDGLFVMTHYPLISFKAETGATTGRWIPIAGWPLPQQVTDPVNMDLSYKIRDAGPERKFQDDAFSPPATLLSYPGALRELPKPVLFSETSNIVVDIILERTEFSVGYTMRIALPGYKIIPPQ